MSISGGFASRLSVLVSPWEDHLHDRQTSSRFPLAELPAGLADRALISHRGVGAFAPASLSEGVYRFALREVSSDLRKIFHLFYKLLKNRRYYTLYPDDKAPNHPHHAAFHDIPMNFLLLRRKRTSSALPMVNDFETIYCKNSEANCDAVRMDDPHFPPIGLTVSLGRGHSPARRRSAATWTTTETATRDLRHPPWACIGRGAGNRVS
jgi:hypothetical protein